MTDSECKHPNACPNGFDAEEARRILDSTPDRAATKEEAAVAFIMGNPMSAEVRRRWPRGLVAIVVQIAG